jgi:hypothetical protein
MADLVQRPSDRRRRWFGLFFLLMAGIMLLWGATWLKPYLQGLGYLLYWLGCFAFTLLAMLTALLDLWVIRKRATLARQVAARESFGQPHQDGSTPHGITQQKSSEVTQQPTQEEGS